MYTSDKPACVIHPHTFYQYNASCMHVDRFYTEDSSNICQKYTSTWLIQYYRISWCLLSLFLVILLHFITFVSAKLRTANSLPIRPSVSCPTTHVDSFGTCVAIIVKYVLFKVERYSCAFPLRNKPSAEDHSLEEVWNILCTSSDLH